MRLTPKPARVLQTNSLRRANLPEGVEPSTGRFSVDCSTVLSYGTTTLNTGLEPATSGLHPRSTTEPIQPTSVNCLAAAYAKPTKAWRTGEDSRTSSADNKDPDEFFCRRHLAAKQPQSLAPCRSAGRRKATSPNEMLAASAAYHPPRHSARLKGLCRSAGRREATCPHEHFARAPPFDLPPPQSFPLDGGRSGWG